jgi:hypothetical protein
MQMLRNMPVANIYFKCFSCIIYMLQVFYLDVAKVDLDVTYVCNGFYKCFLGVSDVC